MHSLLTDADLLYDILRRVNIDFLIAGEKASEFLTENFKAKVAVLYNALNKDDSKTAFSSRDEHPEWFHGLETNCTSKVSSLFCKSIFTLRSLSKGPLSLLWRVSSYHAKNIHKEKLGSLYKARYLRIYLYSDCFVWRWEHFLSFQSVYVLKYFERYKLYLFHLKVVLEIYVSG